MPCETEVITTETPEKFQLALNRATEILSNGGIVALPTETVYGLAANALDTSAVARIYEAKGRPAHNPVIVHVCDGQMAVKCAGNWPETAHRLTDRFWPGPLTLVTPRAPGIPDIVTAGGDTVGLRRPSHPFFEAVIRQCGFPIAAPSANASNRISPTTAAHVLNQLEGRVPLIVDGGPSDVGIESTVVDITGDRPVVLRPGMISPEDIEAAAATELQTDTIVAEPNRGPLRSPGQLSRHYSPTARAISLKWSDAKDLENRVRELNIDPRRAALISFAGESERHSGWLRAAMLSGDPKQAARDFYSALHAADASGAEWIVIESPPNQPAWRAIADRIQRATA